MFDAPSVLPTIPACSLRSLHGAHHCACDSLQPTQPHRHKHLPEGKPRQAASQQGSELSAQAPAVVHGPAQCGPFHSRVMRVRPPKVSPMVVSRVLGTLAWSFRYLLAAWSALWHNTFSSTCSVLHTSPPAAAMHRHMANAVCCTTALAALPRLGLPPSLRLPSSAALPPVTCTLYTLLPVGPAVAAAAALPPVSRDAASGPCCFPLAPVLPAFGDGQKTWPCCCCCCAATNTSKQAGPACGAVLL
eukprot:GHRQ01025271.1.p1 GENE.GHRQ01025271.1~~GHRQ01025271.1.p1  ORF type:complete len:246 (-),score=48.86 GHRQ01025271.1:242-979(-)